MPDNPIIPEDHLDIDDSDDRNQELLMAIATIHTGTLQLEHVLKHADEQNRASLQAASSSLRTTLHALAVQLQQMLAEPL